MRYPISCFLLLLLGLAPAVGRTQPAPSPLTIEDAVATAIKNNPRLSAAVRDVSASQNGVRSARALANPEVVFAPGLTTSGSDEELLVRQPLELNGTRQARTGVASAQLRVSQAEAVVELRDLVFAVKTAYYQLEQAREQQALAREMLESAEEFDRITRRLVELGKRPGIETAQTSIEVARAQQQVILADSQVTVARTALNTLLGRFPDTPVGALSLLSPLEDQIDEAKLAQQALNNRAEITGATAARDAFMQQARLARAEGRPDLAPQFRAGSVTRGFHDSGIGIGITLPLFDWGGRRERIRQSEESAHAQTDRITASQNQVRQDVAQAIARLRAAQAVTQSYRQGILDQSRRLLEGSRKAFQEGATGTSLLTVLEAQRTYRNVQTDYINALANAVQARAELERATGAVSASLLPIAGPEPGRKR